MAPNTSFNLSNNLDVLYLRAPTEDIDLSSPGRGTTPSGYGPVLSLSVPQQMVQLCLLAWIPNLSGVSVLPTAYWMCMSLNLVSLELSQGHHPTTS
jgi:hypothetical protein